MQDPEGPGQGNCRGTSCTPSPPPTIAHVLPATDTVTGCGGQWVTGTGGHQGWLRNSAGPACPSPDPSHNPRGVPGTGPRGAGPQGAQRTHRTLPAMALTPCTPTCSQSHPCVALAMLWMWKPASRGPWSSLHGATPWGMASPTRAAGPEGVMLHGDQGRLSGTCLPAGLT